MNPSFSRNDFMFFGPTVGPPHTGASQSSACTLLAGDTGRWRCGPPPLGCWLGGRKTRRQRRVRVRNSARRGRQRYMAIQTLVFYPSLIGKLSTVNSALKLDIDPSISPHPCPCPAQPHPHLSLYSFGTAHFPFWWFFPLFLSPSDSFTLILCRSGGSPQLGFFFVINVSLPSFHFTCFFSTLSLTLHGSGGKKKDHAGMFSQVLTLWLPLSLLVSLKIPSWRDAMLWTNPSQATHQPTFHEPLSTQRDASEAHGRRVDGFAN